MTSIDKNVSKHLIVGLIYPAVLGTIIYSLLDTCVSSILSGQPHGFLADIPIMLIQKSCLIITIIAFYACDFLYSIFTKDFKIRYLIIDLLILIGVAITFRAINLDSNLEPNIEAILIKFIFFMVLYFFWDYNEILNPLTKTVDLEGRFYRKMVHWEIVSAFCLIITFAMYKLGNLSYQLTLTTTIVLIIAITIFFADFVKRKREFSEKLRV